MMMILMIMMIIINNDNNYDDDDDDDDDCFQRDEALNNFREAIENQKLDLKIVKTKIESTKSEILECQAEHEQMTGIHKRVSKP